MSSTNGRARARPARSADNGTWAASGLAAKLALPLAYQDSVVRERVLERLLDVPTTSLVSIVAPAGYGKTTLLRQWADRATNATYVRIDSDDDDPKRLLTAIAAAIDAVEPLDPGVASLLESPARSLEATVLPQFLDALWKLSGPVLLMLDDVDRLVDPASLDALTWLTMRLPTTVQLAIASRTTNQLPLARWRMEGRLVEVGAADLALQKDDIVAMAGMHRVNLSIADAETLLDKTEGWPAAVYLALLAQKHRTQQGQGPLTLRGDQGSLADYMRDELLAPLDADERRWLSRSSVLVSLSGALCDAALETTGSLARLRALEQRNLFIVPLDEHRATYRYHHLFADALRDVLEEWEPGAASAILRRASRWCEAQGDIEQAIEYAHSAGDMDTVARLVGRHCLAMFWRGRAFAVSRWLGWFDHDGLRERWASIAVYGGWIDALDGRTRAAERWLAAAERSAETGQMPDGSASKAAWVALLRGHMAPNGVTGIVDDAQAAADGIAPDGFWRSAALLLKINASLVMGALEAADGAAVEAIEDAEARGALTALTVANGLRAVIALQRGDTASAATFTQRGLKAVEAGALEDYSSSGLLYGVYGRVAMASGAVEEAKHFIGRFNRLRPQLTAALPVLAVQGRLEAIRALIALRDAAAARTILAEVDDILRVRPDMGWLVSQTTSVRHTVDDMRPTTAGPWTLTTAELRLLGFLPTHLTFAEIAGRLFVSRHTVKTQAVSIYGKLGASSRRAAIEQAVAAGLLDDSVLRFPTGGAGVG